VHPKIFCDSCYGLIPEQPLCHWLLEDLNLEVRHQELCKCCIREAKPLSISYTPNFLIFAAIENKSKETSSEEFVDAL